LRDQRAGYSTWTRVNERYTESRKKRSERKVLCTVSREQTVESKDIRESTEAESEEPERGQS
jgi:hypothetical protein